MTQTTNIAIGSTDEAPKGSRSVWSRNHGDTWFVHSFAHGDALVRTGVDAERIVVVPSEADPQWIADAERRAEAGERIVPQFPYRFPWRGLVVVPTYNERENLEPLVEAVGKYLDCDLLVVDDNSPDGTGRLADELAERLPWIHVLHRQNKEGLGRAYLAGFEWALDREYDRVFEMDADFSHAPWDLPRLSWASQKADLVIGSRYVRGGDTTGWSFHRRLLSRAGNLYARFFLGFGVRDWTAGYRCFDAEILKKIDFDRVRSDGYGFQIEMAYRVREAGGVIREVPVHFVDRREGQSKMSGGIAREAMLQVPSLRFRR